MSDEDAGSDRDNCGLKTGLVTTLRAAEMFLYDHVLTPHERYVIGQCRAKFSPSNYLEEQAADPTTLRFLESMVDPVTPLCPKKRAEREHQARRSKALMRRFLRHRPS